MSRRPQGSGASAGGRGAARANANAAGRGVNAPPGRGGAARSNAPQRPAAISLAGVLCLALRARAACNNPSTACTHIHATFVRFRLLTDRACYLLLVCADAKAHENTLILLDQPNIKGFRFSISKEFWRDRDFYPTLPDRIIGTCDKGWVKTAELTFGILWEDGQRDTALGMRDFLADDVDFRFELYADGRSAPKASRRRIAARGIGNNTQQGKRAATTDRPAQENWPSVG